MRKVIFHPVEARENLSGVRLTALGAILLLCSVASGCMGCSSLRMPNTAVQPVTTRGSTATDYFKQGVTYQRSGRIELSKQALRTAVEMDPGGKIGAAASVFLRVKLPRHTVSTEAEQRNIIGYNAMSRGDLSAAKETFRKLIEDYPDFEWPYGNLAYLAIQQKDFKLAEQLLRSAMRVNPNYLSGWYYFAELERQRNNVKAAREYFDRANALRKGLELSGTKVPD